MPGLNGTGPQGNGPIGGRRFRRCRMQNVPSQEAFNCGTAGSGGQWGRDVTVFPTKGTIIRPGSWGSTLRVQTGLTVQWGQAPPGIRIQ